MWILNFLPDAVFHLMFVAGIIGIIAGFLLGFIPLVGRYKLPIQVISILLFAVGLWYSGGIAKDKEWKAKVAQLEVQLAEARAKSAKVNTEIVTKVVTKRQVVKEKGETIVQVVKSDPEIIRVSESCVIPEQVIKVHNAAALNQPELLKDMQPGTPVDATAVNEAARKPILMAPKK